MAFKDSFHEVAPGHRVNGNAVVLVTRSIKQGGAGSGSKMLDFACFGVASFTLIEVEDVAAWPIPESMIPVEDIDKVYSAMEAAGLSTIVENVLVNPALVGLLEYSDNHIVADSLGGERRLSFTKSTRSSWKREGNNFLVPSDDFDTFKTLALQRLTTALEVVGQFSNSFIRFDGSNDYVDFSAKGATNVNLLDWSKDWTIGVTLTEFQVKSDQKFITLFSSGDNAIMLRRGGTNHGLYLTGNDGADKAGINTWYAPNAGGKLLFCMDATSGRLKYYIGNVDGSYALRGSVSVATATKGNNSPGTNFCIGKRVDNNAVAESLNFHGGMNNVITADEPLAGPLVEEYFQVSETYDESSFYADLISWIKMGEDVFPTVSDEKGVMTGGQLYEGNADDFVEIE